MNRPFPIIALLILLIPLIPPFWLQAAKPADLRLSYDSPEKTITVTNGRLHVAIRVYGYDNPASATPSSIKIETNSRELTPGESAALIAAVRKNKFFSLEESYGAPSNERFYAYSITIIMKGKKKTVVYRGNPSFPSAPEPFNRLEALLLSLAAKK